MDFSTTPTGEPYAKPKKTETQAAIRCLQLFVWPLANVETGFQEGALKCKAELEAQLDKMRPTWRKELAAKEAESSTSPVKVKTTTA